MIQLRWFIPACRLMKELTLLLLYHSLKKKLQTGLFDRCVKVAILYTLTQEEALLHSKDFLLSKLAQNLVVCHQEVALEWKERGGKRKNVCARLWLDPPVQRFPNW